MCCGVSKLVAAWPYGFSMQEIPQHNTTGNKRYYRHAQSCNCRMCGDKSAFRQLVCIRMHEQDAREMAVLVAALLLIGSAFLGTGRGNV